MVEFKIQSTANQKGLCNKLLENKHPVMCRESKGRGRNKALAMGIHSRYQTGPSMASPEALDTEAFRY